MSIESFLILFFLTLSPLGCWMLVPVIWRYRQTAGASSLAALLVAIGWWGLAYAAELWAGDNLAIKVFLSAVKYVGIVVIPVFWLTFAIEYTRTVRIPTVYRRALFIIPLLSLLMLATNPWHGLFRSNVRLAASPLFISVAADFEAWFWVNAAYAYILLIAGTITLLRGLPNLPLIYRRQRVIVFIAALLPLLANVTTLLDIRPVPNLDLTPLAFAITAALLAWGFTRFKLLDLTRLARQQIFSQSPIGIIVIDEGRRVIDVNQTIMTLFNLEAEQLIGQPFHDQFPQLVEALPDFDSLQALYETELAVATAAGEQDYLAQVDVLHSSGDQLEGHVITLLEITGRKEVERALLDKEAEARKLANVASRSTNMVIIADAEGVIEWVNESFTATTGYTLEEVQGRRAGGFLHGPDTDQETALYMRESLAKQEAFSSEVLNYNKEGDPYWVSLSVQPVYDESGRLTNFIAIQTDITKHKNMEENLRQQEVEARQSAYNQKVVYDLLRIISAELDTGMVLERAVKMIVERTGWEMAVIYLPVHAGATLKLAASYPAVKDKGVQQRPLPLPLYRLAVQAYQAEDNAHRSVILPDQQAVAHGMGNGRFSTGQLAVPMRWGIKITGVLAVENKNGQPFTADDISLAEAVTDTLIIGLNNARLYEELDNYLLELSMMHSVSQAATESFDLEEVLRETLMVTISSSEFHKGLILLAEPDSEQLTIAAIQDSENILQPLFENRAFVSTLQQHLAQGNISAWSGADGAQAEEMTQHMLELYWQQANLAVCLTVPLMQQKVLLGAILLFSTQMPKNELPTAMFAAIAPQIATTIASTRLHQEIAQKHSQLITLIGASQDGIILIDTHDVVQVLNEAAHELMSLPDRPQDWEKRPVTDLRDTLLGIAPAAFRTFLEETREPLTPEQHLRQGELEYAGRFIGWVEVLVIKEGGGIIGRLFVQHDVTEERQLLQMRDDLTNTIVHDMRNPLMGIKAAIEMLEIQLGDADEDQKTLIKLAQESSDSLVSLVNGLLDISRLESGRMPLNKQLISIYDVAEQITNLEMPLATQKGITLELDVDLDLPPAYADRNLLLRVFQNLVGNAIKFTPENGRVTIHAAVQPDDFFCIDVSDTGAGIPVNIQESLFQKFTTGQHKNKGSGLGLAFCRLVVEAHGGEIWVESEPGQGSTFKFTLPPEPELMEVTA